MAKHTLRRTSPKGPGQIFLGTCTLCGTESLTAHAALEDCPNQRGLTEGEALVEIIMDKAAPSTFWRDDAFENAAQIVERYFGADAVHCASDIRALKSTESQPSNG